MEFTLQTADGKKIYGMLTGEEAESVVVLLHGLPGSMHDDLYEAADKWFVGRGYAVCRYDQYGPGQAARQLMDCDFDVLESDLRQVIQHLRRNGFSRVFLVGHSFGALLILRSAAADVSATALWDPSCNLSLLRIEELPPPKYVESIDAYALQCGVNYLVSRKLVEQLEDFRWDSVGPAYPSPLKVIVASDGVIKGAEKYAEQAAAARDLVKLDEAGHDFGPEVRDKLFLETHEWFARFE